MRPCDCATCTADGLAKMAADFLAAEEGPEALASVFALATDEEIMQAFPDSIVVREFIEKGE